MFDVHMCQALNLPRYRPKYHQATAVLTLLHQGPWAIRKNTEIQYLSVQMFRSPKMAESRPWDKLDDEYVQFWIR